MKSILLYVSIFAVSCGHGIADKKDITPYISAAVDKYWGSLDTGKVFRLDTIMVLRIDTLTPRSDAGFRVNALIGKVDGLKQRAKYLQTVFELSSQKAILNASLFGKSHLLTKMSKTDAEKARADMTGNLEIMKTMLNQADSINRLILENRLDSVTFLGYLPFVKISAVNNASGVVSVDSVRIRLDKNFHIIEYQDLKN